MRDRIEKGEPADLLMSADLDPLASSKRKGEPSYRSLRSRATGCASCRDAMMGSRLPILLIGCWPMACG